MLACRTREVVLRYALEGPEDAPVMVFVNSLGTDLRVWDRVVAQLAGRFRFLRYDKRGHGLSETTPAPYLMDDHIGDLIGLLDALGIGEAIVVGVSVGGMIAQGLAARRPKRVRGLVLCDTAHRIGPEEMWDQRIRAIQEGGIEALVDAILERWFTTASAGTARTSLPSGGTCWCAPRSTATSAPAPRSAIPTWGRKSRKSTFPHSPSAAPRTAQRRRTWCARWPR